MGILTPLMDLEKFWLMPTRPGPAFTETRTLTMTSNGKQRAVFPLGSADAWEGASTSYLHKFHAVLILRGSVHWVGRAHSHTERQQSWKVLHFHGLFLALCRCSALVSAYLLLGPLSGALTFIGRQRWVRSPAA